MMKDLKALGTIALVCILLLLMSAQAQVTGNSITQPFFASANTAAATVTAAKTLYGWSIVNPNASVCWMQFFNLPSASVTLGTTVPTFAIQLASTGNNNQMVGALGLAFSQGGWSIASTTTATGASTCATGMSVTLFFN